MNAKNRVPENRKFPEISARAANQLSQPQRGGTISVPAGGLPEETPDTLLDLLYVLRFTFPDDQNLPAFRLKSLLVSLISEFVAFALGRPERCVRRWLYSPELAIVQMPVAPMNEDHTAPTRKHKIKSVPNLSKYRWMALPSLAIRASAEWVPSFEILSS